MEKSLKFLTILIGFQIYTVYNTSLLTRVQLHKGNSTQYNERKFNLSSVELPAKYLQPLQLTEEKQRDVQDLLNFVPMPYKAALEQAIRDAGEVVFIDEPDKNDFDFNANVSAKMFNYVIII
jgi:hypothetical protein